MLRRLMTIDELEGSILALDRDDVDVDDDFGDIIAEAWEEDATRIVVEMTDRQCNERG